MQPHQDSAYQPDDLLKEGQVLANQYQVEQFLGAGGMSVVYKCRDLVLGRVVAVKVMGTQSLINERMQLRFHQEAKAVGQLQHPNIVALHNCDFAHLPPFMVMDYVQGRPLSEVLAKEGALPVDRCLIIASRIVDALKHAHSHNVVHRDLKPSNIVMVSTNFPIIVDFGIAKIVTETLAPKMTQTGELFGSPAYMSPEQVAGGPITAACDQYSFGCVLFEMLTGCCPFVAANSVEIMFKHLNEKPPTLSQSSLGRKFPPYLEAVVARLLEKQPEKRFANMAELGEALQSREQSNATTFGATSVHREKPYSTVQVTIAAALGLVLVAGLLWGAYAMLAAKPDAQAKTSKSDADNQLESAANSALYTSTKSEQPTPSEKESASATTPPLVDTSDQVFAYKDFEGWRAKHPNVAELIVQKNYDLESSTGVFDDRYVGALAELPNLAILDLTNCSQVQGHTLSLLKKLPLLQLHLDRTAVDDEGLKQAATLPDLKILSVRKCPHVSNSGIAALKKAPQLDGLFLTRAPNITSACFPDIAQSKVRLIDLCDEACVHGHLDALAKGQRLNQFFLANTNLTDSDVAALTKNKNIAVLDIRDNPELDDQALKQIASEEPDLSKLLLDGCTKIQPAAVDELRRQHERCKVSYSATSHHSPVGQDERDALRKQVFDY